MSFAEMAHEIVFPRKGGITDGAGDFEADVNTEMSIQAASH